MTESLSEERDYFWKEVYLLQNTEGFPRLTEEQQRMIILSLYLQDRSERKGDSYFTSTSLIDLCFCHGSVQGLETGFSTVPELLDYSLPHFFDTEYFPVFNKAEAIKLLESFGFPCVVHLQRRLSNIGLPKPSHTFLALGHDPTGEIIVWEKEGFSLPFRITNLTVELDEYQQEKHWGIRKLRTVSGAIKKRP